MIDETKLSEMIRQIIVEERPNQAPVWAVAEEAADRIADRIMKLIRAEIEQVDDAHWHEGNET